MTSESQNKTIVSPSIKEFTNNLALLLEEPETVEVFRNGTPEQKIEKVLLATDRLLEPEGKFILVNANLPLKDLIKFGE